MNKKYLSPASGMGNQRGAAAVEFALVLPLLVVILFGIIEFSVMLFDKNVITNASREGARFGILAASPRHTVDEITGVVNTYCAANLISFGAAPAAPVTAVVGAICGNSGVDNLTVNVTYPYTFLVLPNFVAGIMGTTNLVAQTVMLCE